MVDLNSIHSNVSIVELTTIDVIKKTDNYNLAFELIKSHQDKYPEIEKWFATKVSDGIIHNTRTVFVGFDNEKPFATAVVKKGEDSKFCHLHIDEKLRHKNIGDVFFMLMATRVKGFAKQVHFSLPEGLWEEKKSFFNSFGFQEIEKYRTQYRKFEEELTCSIDFRTLWRKVLFKLPILIKQFDQHPDSPLNGIVMSIRPNYSKKIMDGDKLIEIRKKFNSKWKNHKVTIYSSSPQKELLGYATINNIIEDKPETIWERYSKELGCSKSEFDNYTRGQGKIFAICLCNINKFGRELSLSFLSNCLERTIHPPQSYSAVKNTEWKEVVSIAELLHNRFTVF